MLVSSHFLWFLFYSFVGWLYESTICSIIKQNRFINRGYLLGPYCPIYGAGAVMNIILLCSFKNSFLILIITMITSGILEYLTSYLMEKLFHSRWWDYSNNFLNLRGRICFICLLIFGLANLILIKIFHPFVMQLTNLLSPFTLNVAAIILLSIILIDVIFTTIHINSFNAKLNQLENSVNVIINNSKSTLCDRRSYIVDNLKAMDNKEILINFFDLRRKHKHREARVFFAFPKFHSTRYIIIAEKIMELIEK